MYEGYWQLNRKPFENSLEPGTLFFSETHHAALLKMQYAVENRRDTVVLAGGPGTGKSLLVRTLANQLTETFSPVAELTFPQMPPDQLLNYLADELTGESTSGTGAVERSVRRLRRFLRENGAHEKHAVVIIDEAHLLRSTESLEVLRLLTNLERGATAAFTLVLVGQPSLLTLLDRTPELDDRIDTRCVLSRFQIEETAAYIEHRLALAGAKRPLFNAAALELIHQLSTGIPRRVNRLCDLGLIVGLAEGLDFVGPEQIRSVQEELQTSRTAA